ncbi:hypothetical protein GCM10009839_54400 [Catenulispora yoronensis]|uniref:Carrier domain-containing protein n=1 Tax=Catenulispora yoronensis TaxID=450799 RepID=A0ABN2UW54_9ACTN
MTNTDEVSQPVASDEQTDPRTVEERVAALFDDLLAERAPAGGAATGFPATGFPAAGDFFERGGNSMLAARLVARLRREFDVKVSIRDVFRGRTVAAVAQAVHDRLGAER